MATGQIGETDDATGMAQNSAAGKKGGRIARRARLGLEEKTGRKVVTGENFLPPGRPQKKVRIKHVVLILEQKCRPSSGLILWYVEHISCAAIFLRDLP